MELNEFKNNTRDSREYKRALAVEMKGKGYHPEEVSELLGVHASFVRKWWNIFKKSGRDASCLSLAYKGSRGYLDDTQRSELIEHIGTLDHWTLREMKNYIKKKYGVEYKSDKSYQELMKKGKLSWKKTEKANPLRKPEEAEKRVAEIKKNWNR